MEYKNTWTYHAIVPLANFGFNLFNHGTESKPKTRTAQHINECKAQKLSYKVLEEKQDRLFGTDVIEPTNDKEFINKVVVRLNDTVLKGSAQKAFTLKDWFKSLSVLSPIDRGYYDALKLSHLSETECCMIPDSVSEDQIRAAWTWVEEHWYYKEKNLRVSAKPYSILTKGERKMAAKPFPIKAFNKVFEFIRHGKRFVERLNYKTAWVQGILLAWSLSLQDDFRNLQKITVIITGNDKDKYKDLYEAMLQDAKFTVKDCESDNDVIEEYIDMDINTDLIVSNPPYGSVGANVTKRIIEVVNFKSFVNLLPANDYKRNTDKDLFNYQSDMVSYKNPFGKDATVTTHLAIIHKQKVNNLTEDEFKVSTYIDRSLDKYFKVNLNKSSTIFDNYDTGYHPENWSVNNTFIIGQRVVAAGGLPQGTDNDMYRWNVEKTLTYQDLINNHNPNCYTKKGIIRVTFSAIIFPTDQEKDNFTEFVYSNRAFISKIFKAVNIDSGTYPLGKLFPKVDWSRKWTVEEILKEEYGYTDPEINKIIAGLN